MEVTHMLLARASTRTQAEQKVLGFLKDYQLVCYDTINLDSSNVIQASSPLFWGTVNDAINRNRLTIKALLEQLSEEGYGQFEHLHEIPQGYLSKIFHTVAHILDGFFGIDSYFYNLLEDSHWVSREFIKEINAHPSEYWLVKVMGLSNTNLDKMPESIP